MVPFLVEDELLRLGATIEKLANWQPFSIVDAIGCSGGTDSQDEIVSKAGAAVINQLPPRNN